MKNKKEVMFYISLAILLIVLLIIDNRITNNAVEQCVAGGNSRSFCVNGLAR